LYLGIRCGLGVFLCCDDLFADDVAVGT
jgi:hypothetical protein